MNLNFFSIIIPTSRSENEKKMQETIANNNYCKDKLEVIIINESYGKFPAEKRNIGVNLAKNKYLIFLDDDVELPIDYFTKLDLILKDSNADVVGGPNLGHNLSHFEKLVDLAFSSRLGFAHGAKRFKEATQIEAGNENNLTSCNLCIKKKCLVEIGGFNPDLFPGEEVDLVKRLKSRGYFMIYHPEFILYHKRRDNIKSLFKQIFAYGKGRSDLIRLSSFSFTDTIYFVPAALIIYLSVYFFLINTPLGYGLHIYIFSVCSVSFFKVIRNRYPIKDIFTLNLIYFTIHIAYGMGLIKGLISWGRD